MQCINERWENSWLGKKITSVIQYMQEEAKLVEESFQLLQIINRNLRSTIPK